jgi:nucleoside-diphosphate-sugar epimerase
MSRVALVIGSHGFIGGYVCQRLIEGGWEVVGVDSLNMYKPQQYMLYMRHFDVRQRTQLAGLSHFYRMDGSHAVEMARIIARHRPAIVLNLGGTPVADVCKQNIDEAVSSIYLLNAALLQALKEYDGLDRYVYVSSSMVYGDFDQASPSEDTPKRPKDPYGAIKLGGEYLVQSFHRQFKLPYVIIRPSAVYGPLDSNMRVTGIFMLNAHTGRPLRVHDETEQLDFTYVEDLAEGIVRALTRPEALNHTFNMTRGEGRTIGDLAREIQRQFPWTQIQYGAAAEHMQGLIRPMRGTLDISLAKRVLDYNPRYSLADGIAKYAEEWKSLHGESMAVVV